MASLTTAPATAWMNSVDEMTDRLFGRDDYELYEDDGEFTLTVELPGFERDDIDVRWRDGQLNVAAEREGPGDRAKTYHRSFRFPREIDEDGISAEYRNGVLEVTLPVASTPVSGTEIEIE